ncbi:hypothetical protein bcere0019_7790 [Bacillus cereus Rock3-28]|nr:hypothetical protein bcere0019_7790 [Bacillus cereus Rock3-28]
MLFFVQFACFHTLYGYYKTEIWKVEKCDEIVWVTKCKCDWFG